MIEELDTYVDEGSLFRRCSRERGFAFLDSACRKYGLGRFSYYLWDPSREARYRNRELEIRSSSGILRRKGDPFELIRGELEDVKSDGQAPFPFCGGAVGYFGYELGAYVDDVSFCEEKAMTGYEMRFAFYDAGLCIDHREQRMYAFVHPLVEDPMVWLERLRNMVLGGDAQFSLEECQVGELESNFTRESYMDSVESIRNAIRDGEVYQANLSQRFEGSFVGDPASVYEKLRTISPAPYGCYLDFGDEQILSNSPEQLLRSEGRRVVTRPIKGTRARGCNEDVNAKNRNELAQSEKDKSELLMIVDLERNDMGKSCEPGSIEVEGLFQMEEYATVFHQTASVSGTLREGVDALGCLRGMFPGGSITGAPKLRAMEIIDELEKSPRGVYTGAVGFLAYNGEVDLNVAIRTLHCRDGKISFNVGAGIVWDSDPSDEYEETLHKAVAMKEAINHG